MLRGDKLLPAAEAVEIVRALPHGHVLAALGTARRIALDAVLPRRAPQRRRDLALALIVARLLEPAAKLATALMLDPATASHSLGEVLGLGRVTAKEVYAALDWLGSEQPFIEARLARRHLKNGALLLYDVTSTEIRAIAWTGAVAPAFPNFPRSQGLSGAAVSSGQPVIVQDAARDQRWLTTFSTSKAEAIFPVTLHCVVVGTVDVESDRVAAFTSEDEDFLRGAAVVLRPLWAVPDAV